MSEFTELPTTQLLPGGTKRKLVKPFSYYIKKKGGDTIVVPAGFITDGASIPRFAWSIIGGPMSGKYVAAAILHDWLYHIQTFSRKKSDLIFLKAMAVLGVTRLKRKTIYWAVRIGGRWAWNSHKREKAK